jgi:hypothetical protein
LKIRNLEKEKDKWFYITSELIYKYLAVAQEMRKIGLPADAAQ